VGQIREIFQFVEIFGGNVGMEDIEYFQVTDHLFNFKVDDEALLEFYITIFSQFPIIKEDVKRCTIIQIIDKTEVVDVDQFHNIDVIFDWDFLECASIDTELEISEGSAMFINEIVERLKFCLIL
jgi:hypothetical protein